MKNILRGAAWPADEPEDNYPQTSANTQNTAFESEPVDADLVTETVDADVVICGLGISGIAAALFCARRGLGTVVPEKIRHGVVHPMTVFRI